ncbi:MAG: MFS transporter [Chloroflexi bacterium]|nr:MFS transporter [Chloroflexota bacterium]
MFNSNRLLALWPKRVFYGWCVVGVAMMVSFTQVGEFNPVLAVFMHPLNQEFGWSRAEISAAITFGSLGGAALAPLVGPLLDRRGAQVVLVVGQLLFGGALIASALVGSLWQFYITYSVGRAVVQGVTSLAVQVAVANWFRRNRALAMGMAALGTRVGQATLPLLMQFIIGTAGWRAGFIVLGLLVWIVGVLPSAIFLRQRPEDLGLRPDGDAPLRAPVAAAKPAAAATVLEEPSWTLGQAQRTPALWLLTLAVSQASMVGAGVNLHMAPYLMDQGLSPVAAVGALSAFAATSGLGGLFWGYVVRRVPTRLTITALFLWGAAAILLLMNVQTVAGAYGFAVFYGIAFGGWHSLSQSMWADYFGRHSVGSIVGFTAPFSLAANSSGPLLAGFLFDRLGNYHAAFTFFTGAYVLAAVWMFLARPPRRPARVQAAP